MLRFGTGLTHLLKVAAKLYVTHGRGTEFLCETSMQQTRLQKSIRQMQRKLLSKTPMRPVPDMTPAQIAFHGGLTANREHFTLAAINAAKAGKVTKVSIDDL